MKTFKSAVEEMRATIRDRLMIEEYTWWCLLEEKTPGSLMMEDGVEDRQEMVVELMRALRHLTSIHDQLALIEKEA